MNKVLLSRSQDNILQLNLCFVSVDLDNFPKWAEYFSKYLDAKIIDRTSASGTHFWKLEVESVILRLCFDDCSNNVWLEPESEDNEGLVEFIKGMIQIDSNLEEFVT